MFISGRHLCFLAALSAQMVVALAQAEGLEGETPSVSLEVAEVRFGVVEPPVVAQKDITLRFPTTRGDTTPMPLECSGLAWLGDRLLLSSDQHEHSLFTCKVDLQTMHIDDPQQHIVILNEQDLLMDAESIALRHHLDNSWTAYVTCSLSNDPAGQRLPKRQHMARFRFSDPTNFLENRPIVLDASQVRTYLDEVHFEAIGVKPYRTYYANADGKDKNTYRWGDVEGVTLTYDGQRMVCGMRNPLYGGQALVFIISNVDWAFQKRNPSMLEVTDLFTLDLGGRGISGMDWDHVTGGYLITAAKSNGPWMDRDQPFPPTFLDSALFWWSGRKDDKPILFARMPDMTIEGVCRLGMERYIAIVSDEGDISESRTERQSVVTILDFTGLNLRSSP